MCHYMFTVRSDATVYLYDRDATLEASIQEYDGSDKLIGRQFNEFDMEKHETSVSSNLVLRDFLTSDDIIDDDSVDYMVRVQEGKLRELQDDYQKCNRLVELGSSILEGAEGSKGLQIEVFPVSPANQGVLGNDYTNGLITQAAHGRRKTWQGHDERDEELCEEGAYELLDALTGEVDDKALQESAEMTRRAFWTADKAEEHQDQGNPDLENQAYQRATELLKDSRENVGLPERPMDHRGKWWKAYRNENKSGLFLNLAREDYSHTGLGGTLGNTKLLLEAAKAHKENDWPTVDGKLEEVYRDVLTGY